MSRRRDRNRAGPLPPLLVRLIHAAARNRQEGESKALRVFGELALIEIPARGVLTLNDAETDLIIDDVAQEHLGLRVPRQEFFRATAEVESVTHRDAIESAHSHFRSVSDRTYFYVGLAFGTTLAQITELR